MAALPESADSAVGEAEEEESELVEAAVEESAVDFAVFPAMTAAAAVDCELELMESVVAAEGSALAEDVAVVDESASVEFAAVAELKESAVVEASLFEPESAEDSGCLESEAAVKELAVVTAFLASEVLLKELVPFSVACREDVGRFGVADSAVSQLGFHFQ